MRVIATSIVVVLGLASCGGFKSGATDGGADGAAPADGGGSDGGSHAGPGPYGALPSGYCCTQSSDCRYRHCVDIGGSKACADECMSQDPCDGGLPGLICVGAGMGKYGLCQPKTPMTACVPAAQFTYGSKKLGQCCTPTWNGANGNECEGGHCGQFGNDPFMCTQACSKGADCPGDFLCSPVSNDYSLCIPGSSATMCKP